MQQRLYRNLVPSSLEPIVNRCVNNNWGGIPNSTALLTRTLIVQHETAVFIHSIRMTRVQTHLRTIFRKARKLATNNQARETADARISSKLLHFIVKITRAVIKAVHRDTTTVFSTFLMDRSPLRYIVLVRPLEVFTCGL